MASVDFYDKDQIDALNVGKDTDTASATGSLWARIKNALSRIGTLETADTQNVKLTGAQTKSGVLTLTDSPIIPTTPATDDSAVNSFYVNDSTGTVGNNIVHQDGNEPIGGIKEINGLLQHPMEDVWINQTSTSNQYIRILGYPVTTTTHALFLEVLALGRHGNIDVVTDNNGSSGLIELHTRVGGEPSTLEAFVLTNVTTSERELWVRVVGGFRLYFNPKCYTINNVAQDISKLTKYGNRQNTDPSSDTTKYPDGKTMLDSIVITANGVNA